MFYRKTYLKNLKISRKTRCLWFYGYDVAFLWNYLTANWKELHHDHFPKIFPLFSESDFLHPRIMACESSLFLWWASLVLLHSLIALLLSELVTYSCSFICSSLTKLYQTTIWKDLLRKHSWEKSCYENIR